MENFIEKHVELSEAIDFFKLAFWVVELMNDTAQGWCNPRSGRNFKNAFE